MLLLKGLLASLLILNGLILSSFCLGMLNLSFLKLAPAVFETGTPPLFFSPEKIGSPFSRIDYWCSNSNWSSIFLILPGLLTFANFAAYDCCRCSFKRAIVPPMLKYCAKASVPIKDAKDSWFLLPILLVGAPTAFKSSDAGMVLARLTLLRKLLFSLLFIGVILLKRRLLSPWL